MDSIEDIADRLERAADRYHNANDFQAESDARQAAARARRAASPLEAEQVEAAFFRGRAPGPSQVLPSQPDLEQNAGCLGGLFGGRGRSSGASFRSTSYYRPGMIRSQFMSGQYHRRTVADAVAQHVPPGYANPQSYATAIAAAAGVAPAMLIGALTEVQLRAITDAIENDPNWRRQPGGGTSFDDSNSRSDNWSGGSYSDAPREDFASGDPSAASTSPDFGSVDTSAPTPTDNS